VIDNSKVCVGMLSISIKEAQPILQKPLFGPRKLASDGNNGTKQVN